MVNDELLEEIRSYWLRSAYDPPPTIRDTRAYSGSSVVPYLLHQLDVALARAERAEEREARLREALEDALDGLLDMRPHVFNCFARKGGYDGYIERATAALTAAADEEDNDA